MPDQKHEIRALGVTDGKGDFVFCPSETELRDIERAVAALVRFCRTTNAATGRYSDA